MNHRLESTGWTTRFVSGFISNLEWDFPLNNYSDRVYPQDDAKWLHGQMIANDRQDHPNPIAEYSQFPAQKPPIPLCSKTYDKHGFSHIEKRMQFIEIQKLTIAQLPKSRSVTPSHFGPFLPVIRQLSSAFGTRNPQPRPETICRNIAGNRDFP